MRPLFLGRKLLQLTDSEQILAKRQMDGTNFDCNKCSKIIMALDAECQMGGKKGEIPDICYEYGAVCKECFQEALIIN